MSTLTAVLVRVHAYIKTLGYADPPDYDHLQGLLTLSESEQLAVKPTAQPPLQTPLMRGTSSAPDTNGVHTPLPMPHSTPTPGVAVAATPRTGSVASVGPPKGGALSAARAAPVVLKPAEPSRAAVLAASIMQSSAAARRALEAQRVRCCWVIQPSVCHGGVRAE